MLPAENWVELFGRYPDILEPYQFDGDQFSACIHLLEQVTTVEPGIIEAIPGRAQQRSGIESALSQFAQERIMAEPSPTGESIFPAGFSMDTSRPIAPERLRNLRALALVSANIPYLRDSLGLGEPAIADRIGGVHRAVRETLAKNYQAFLREHRARPFPISPEPEITSELEATEPLRAARPTPEPIVRLKESGTAGDSVEHLISHSYRDEAGEIHLGADIGMVHVNFIRNYIRFDGVLNKDKHLVLKYYSLADPRVADAIEDAVKAKIKITVITDLNRGLVGRFRDGEKKSVDFENAAFKDSASGRVLQRLLGMGFKYGKKGRNTRLTIVSGVPLFDPNDTKQKDLMHDKATVALGPGGKAYSLSINGTANLTPMDTNTQGPLPTFGGFFNGIYLEKDRDASQVDWDHVQAEIEAYRQRESFAGDIEIVGNPDHQPIRFVYPDGTYKEIAFTDSIQNPNDRIKARIQEAIDSMKSGSNKKIIVEEIVLTHFVLTHTEIVEKIRELMKVQPWVKVWGLFDQQFIWLDGWGAAGALAGFLAMRPFGRSVFPFPSDFEHRMELYGYQRLLDGVERIDPDKLHYQIHIMHRKLSMLKTVEFEASEKIKGVIAQAAAEGKIDKIIAEAKEENLWTYAWERSFNASNAFRNLESQTEHRFHRGSPVARRIEEGVKGTAKSEPEFALPLHVAVARDFLARFAEHTPYDVDVQQYVINMIEAFKGMDYERVRSIIEEVAALATKNIQPINVARVAARTEKFIAFLQWYAGERNEDVSLNRMTFKKAIYLGWALTLENDPYKLKLALDILYYHPNRTWEKRLELMKRAWQEGLHMDIPFPEKKSPPPVLPNGEESSNV